MKSFPKPQRFESKDYRTFVASMPCVCHNHGGCEGDVTAHHVFAGGMGTKCDDTDCIPLCHKHHAELEAPGKGKKWFYAEYLIDVWREIARCQSAWIRAQFK